MGRTAGNEVGARSVKDARNSGGDDAESVGGSGHVSGMVLVRSVPSVGDALVDASDGGEGEGQRLRILSIEGAATCRAEGWASRVASRPGS